VEWGDVDDKQHCLGHHSSVIQLVGQKLSVGLFAVLLLCK